MAITEFTHASPVNTQYNWGHLYAWCSETFGVRGIRWTAREGKYWFRDERDLTWFMLRWSQ